MLSWLFFDPTYQYGYVNGPYSGLGMYGTGPTLPEPTERDKYVEARLHSLELACAGLWELLKQKNGYSDEELAGLIKALDQKRSQEASPDKCPRCGRPVLTHNHTKCLWCGQEMTASPFVPPAS
jgi:hypothetical protein